MKPPITRGPHMRIRILPSLLAADTGRLATEALRAADAGADELHLDIMDGHFVPNISFGPDVVAMAKKTIRIPLNVHLMLTNPEKYIAKFADAGADTIQIHVESACDVAATLADIRSRGIRAGIVINPETPPEAAFPFLKQADELLCMTVHPGYGGQKFMESVVPHIAAIRAEAGSLGLTDFDIMVDGGVSLATAPICARAGANAFVAGSALFRAEDMAGDISKMKISIQNTFNQDNNQK